MFPPDRRVLLAISLLVLSPSGAACAETSFSSVARATTLTKHGEDLAFQQKVDDAIAAFEEAGTLYQKLLDQNPADMASRSNRAVWAEKFGDMLVGNNRLDRAAANYQKSLEIRQALADQDPGNPDRLHDLAMSLARMGRVSILQHQLSASLQFYQKACLTGDRLMRGNQDNYGWITELAINENWVGEILLLLKNYDEAADACALIVDTVKSLPETASSDF